VLREERIFQCLVICISLVTIYCTMLTPRLAMFDFATVFYAWSRAWRVGFVELSIGRGHAVAWALEGILLLECLLSQATSNYILDHYIHDVLGL
jgi:hypothetical protein